MSNILGLDLSKRSTGWAVWREGSDKPELGHWVLGSEYTSDGRTYCKLHECLSELLAVMKFESIYYEEPLRAEQLTGHTNIDSLRVLTGLAAHAESFGAAMGMRITRSVKISSWRKGFIGSQKRGTKSATFKDLTMQRCRQLGINPSRHDEADAFGILDYACTLQRIVSPWRANDTRAVA